MGLRAQLLLGPVPLDEPPEDVLHDLQETGQEQIRRLLTPKGEFFLGYNEPDCEDLPALVATWSEACGRAWGLQQSDGACFSAGVFAEEGDPVWESSKEGAQYWEPAQRAFHEALELDLDVEDLVEQILSSSGPIQL